MADVIKSIFRQREIEKLYELRVREDFCYGIYCLEFKSSVEVGNKKMVLSDKVIGSYDIKIPMLEIGDEFFLHDI